MDKVSSDRTEWVHELRLRTLVCRSEAECWGEPEVVVACDAILARLDVLVVPAGVG